jgi:hypothetical protein
MKGSDRRRSLAESPSAPVAFFVLIELRALRMSGSEIGGIDVSLVGESPREVFGSDTLLVAEAGLKDLHILIKWELNA